MAFNFWTNSTFNKKLRRLHTQSLIMVIIWICHRGRSDRALHDKPLTCSKKGPMPQTPLQHILVRQPQLTQKKHAQRWDILLFRWEDWHNGRSGGHGHLWSYNYHSINNAAVRESRACQNRYQNVSRCSWILARSMAITGCYGRWKARISALRCSVVTAITTSRPCDGRCMSSLFQVLVKLHVND